MERADSLVRMLRVRHALPAATPVSRAEALRLCVVEGARVFEVPGLERPGYYLGGRYRAIVLRPSVPARVIVHELIHYLTDTEADAPLVQQYADREQVACAAELLLCGPED